MQKIIGLLHFCKNSALHLSSKKACGGLHQLDLHRLGSRVAICACKCRHATHDVALADDGHSAGNEMAAAVAEGIDHDREIAGLVQSFCTLRRKGGQLTNRGVLLEYYLAVSVGKYFHRVALLDFDGFNYYCEEAMKIRYRAYVLKCRKEKRPIVKKEKDFTDIKDMKAAVNFAHTPVGHAFVVKALLQGDIEVVNGQVIDHVGMLA